MAYATRLVMLVVIYLAIDAKYFVESKGPLVTDLVYFDIEIDNVPAGRIIFGLFGKVVPKTVENFIRLAVHDKGYGYTGSRFTQVLKTYNIMGGTFKYGNKTGGVSWFGSPFEHENYRLKHYGEGWVSMASVGRDSISSQFHIITDELYSMREWYDNRYVVFAAVLHGIDVVHKIESLDTLGLVPRKRAVVVASGTLKMAKRFAIAKDYIPGNLISRDGIKF